VIVVLGVTSALVGLGLLACMAPALRAARIQPTEALRDG
jgi:ABC-type lipoprotein release transport system permease subunit